MYLQAQFRNCKELHDLAEHAQERIKKIQQEYLDRADEMRKTLTDKFNEEVNYSLLVNRIVSEPITSF